MSLRVELKQGRPFDSLAEEVSLNILRTAEVVARGIAEALRPHGLTATQYNVLRILRGAPPEGMACMEVGSRMLTHEPDVTRMLDRMERQGLLSRERATDDRRVVLTRITEAGRELVGRLDGPIDQLHRRQLAALGEEELQGLKALLTAVRASASAAASSAAAPAVAHARSHPGPASPAATPASVPS